MKIDRRSAVAVLCAVALCLAGLTVWDGIYHTRNTARTQLLEQLSDLSDYSSHYVRMYFDNLLQLSEDAASPAPDRPCTAVHTTYPLPGANT